MLEDLLEQEKREQEKQLQTQPLTSSTQELSTNPTSSSALLSDHDFERLKADVFNNSSIGLPTNTAQAVPGILSCRLLVFVI